MWSDVLELDRYHTMNDSRAPDFGPPPSSVLRTGTTNHKVHGNLRTDAPVSDSVSTSNTSAHYSEPPLDSYHMPYAIIRPDIRVNIDYRPLSPSPSNSRVQTSYRNNVPIRPVQGSQHHGTRLTNQLSPMDLTRHLWMRTPSPSLSVDETLSGKHFVTSLPIVVTQPV